MKYVSGPLRRFAPNAVRFSRSGTLLFAGAVLTGCSGLPGAQSTFAPSQSTLASSLAAPGAGLSQSLRSQPALGPYASHWIEKNAGKERVLYSFGAVSGSFDGVFPSAGLTDVGGVLYGTTEGGGAAGPSGGGTVFMVTTSGAESVVHSFMQNTRDGFDPGGGLTKLGGALYGTTSEGGGTRAAGTVFKIATSGVESILHRFAGANDGALPFAGLSNVGGTLYGTTYEGGGGGRGTVFKITTSGAESVLYSFGGGNDGAFPHAALTNVGGTLYGTTETGGAHGRGTVFKITTSGAENVLYSFAGGIDGDSPFGGLTNVDGTLYGTTTNGGGYSNCDSGRGCGTVFRITTSGEEKVLYSFAGGADGFAPTDRLTNVGGTLYGTTAVGGDAKDCSTYHYPVGCGTVFKVTTSGTESVLYSFSGGNDGARPNGDLIKVGGRLYGTTADGGAYGFGTAFSLPL